MENIHLQHTKEFITYLEGWYKINVLSDNENEMIILTQKKNKFKWNKINMKRKTN